MYLDGDVPVTPTSTMGQSSAIAAAVMNANGIPLNKVQKILFGKMPSWAMRLWDATSIIFAKTHSSRCRMRLLKR